MATNTQTGASGRQNLIPQERGQDVHWYSGGVPRHGKFGSEVYGGWGTTENYVEEEFDFTPITNAQTNAYGGTVVFELDKRGARWIGLPYLMYDRTAITNATDLGNGVAFVDYESVFSVSQIRWIYGNREFYRLSSLNILTDILTTEHEEERARFKELCLGGFDLLARQNMAKEAKTLYLPLRVPWRKLKKAITAEGLPNKVRVEVDFATYQNATTLNPSQTYNDTVGPTLANIRYRQRFVHYKQATRDNAFKYTRNPNAQITHKFFQRELHCNEQISSGTSLATIKIPNLKNNTFLIRCFFRNQADLLNVNKTYTRFYLPWRMWLQDQGQPITNYYYPFKLGCMENMGKMHPAASTLLGFFEINFANFEWIEASEDNCFGGRTLGKYNNVELVIDFAQGTTVPKWDTFLHFPNMFCSGTSGAAFNVQMDLEGHIHNNFIEGNGDIRKNLL